MSKPRFNKAKTASKAPKAPKVAVELPQTPQQLEAVLAALLAPDTAQIEAATRIVDAFLKHAEAIPACIQQVAQSTNPHARQMAAVLMRRVIVKLWSKLKPEQQVQAKTVLLTRLLDEPERLVRHSIGVLISTLAASLVPKGQWNDLLDQLLALCRHPSENHREIAMMLFSALAENIPATLKKHFNQLFELFSSGLNDPSVKVRTEALTALATLVDMLDDDEPERIAQFSTVIEPLIAVMAANSHHEDVLSAGFEVLDTLAEGSTGVLDPFIPRLTEFMCQIALNQQTGAGVREKAATLVTDIIKHKAHRLLKPNNLIPALLQVAFKLGCEPYDIEDCDEVTSERLGIEMIDAIMLNLHIAKKDIFPLIIQRVGELIGQGQSADSMKGGLLVLAVMAEGCAPYLIDRLPQLVPVACAACTYTSPIANQKDATMKVRKAACFVIEQFADYLHPDISAYHSQILPCLLQILTNPQEEPLVKEKCCSALDVFCQHLDSDIGQYIASVVPPLLHSVSDPLSHVSRSAMHAIKAVASAAKKQFEPYLNSAMEVIGAFLTKKEDEQIRQRCAATECIGALGAAVGKDRFRQAMSAEPGRNFYDISFHMVTEGFLLNFSELRESSYLYFSDMCEMMGEEFNQRLGVVMPLILGSLFTDDGVELAGARAGFNDVASEEEQSMDEDAAEPTDSDEDADDDGPRRRVVIRTDALDEKISAFNFVTTVLPVVRCEDMSYWIRRPVADEGTNRDIFTALWELSEYPHPYVRCANVQALRELLMWFHRAVKPAKQWTQMEEVPLHESVKDMIEECVVLIVERMDDEEDRQCAAEACDALGEVLQKYGTIVLQQEMAIEKDGEQAMVPMPTHLLNLLIRFLQEKAPSQQPDDDIEDDAERQEMQDHDFVLMENVSDLIAILAQAMGPRFEPAFRLLFPLMERFLKPDKQAPTKGMAMGCFAEIIMWLSPQPGQPPQQQHPLNEYLPKLIGYTLQSLQDPSPLVRRNGSFAAGCLAMIPSPVVQQVYPQFLQLLGACYQAPTGPVDPVSGIMHGSLKDTEFLGARDNACSAISKMIATAPQWCGQPMNVLIDLFLNGLPLQCDFLEAKQVYPALMNLYRTHAHDITPHTERVVSIFSRVFGNPDVDLAVQREMVAFSKELVRQAPQELERIYAKLQPAEQAAFKAFVIDHNPVVAAK